MAGDYRSGVQERRTMEIRAMLKTLPPSCEDFIRSITMTTSVLTRYAYVVDLRLFFGFLAREDARFSESAITRLADGELAQITARDLERFMEYLSLYYREADLPRPNDAAPVERAVTNNESGVMRKMSTLRSYFQYLFEKERIPANVAAKVPLPKLHEKPILRLEPEEVEALLETVTTGDSLTEKQLQYHKLTAARDYALMMVFLGTGMRVSECVGLNLSDLDLDANALLVTRKGGDQAFLYYPDEVSAALRDYLSYREQIIAIDGHEDAVFLSLQKRRMTQRAIEKLVKKYAAIAAPLKKRMSPHKLRSTYATSLYQETGDIYLVADALGHSNVNTTRKHYASMTESHRRQAAAHVKLPRGGVGGASSADGANSADNAGGANGEISPADTASPLTDAQPADPPQIEQPPREPPSED